MGNLKGQIHSTEFGALAPNHQYEEYFQPFSQKIAAIGRRVARGYLPQGQNRSQVFFRFFGGRRTRELKRIIVAYVRNLVRNYTRQSNPNDSRQDPRGLGTGEECRNRLRFRRQQDTSDDTPAVQLAGE